MDVKHLTAAQREHVVSKALQTSDQDNERFLQKWRERMDRCGRGVARSTDDFRVCQVILECEGEKSAWAFQRGRLPHVARSDTQVTDIGCQSLQISATKHF